jgi:hypothetical protein
MVAAAVTGAAVGATTLGETSLGVTALSAGANVLGAQSAAGAQTTAAQNATELQSNMFTTGQQNLQPFINTGSAAASKIADLQGLNGGTPSSIQSTLEGLPGYQFANYQGLKSVQNSATARGLGVSGAAQKGAANFSTGLANSYYNNLLTGLQGTENTGANAAAGLASSANTAGSNIGNNIIGAGNAQAGASIATGNALGSVGQGGYNGLVMGQLLQNQNNLTNQNNSFLSQPPPIDQTSNGFGVMNNL